MSVPLYPLRFQEILRDYRFGDRWIVEAYEKSGLPENHRVGETWEVCDRPNGESSRVINGALVGVSLHELIDRYGVDLLGEDVVARCGMRFPLLIKFLDASHTLAEQAHHNDELAAKEGLEDPGKTEAWYMLKTRPGATIRCGNKPGVFRDQVRAALLAGNIKEMMREYEVSPGDAFLLYAGTMHYSSGGVLFYEIMQNSDVYIGLRAPDPELPQAEREALADQRMEGVHIESGFDVRIPPIVLQQDWGERSFVFACRYFALERLDLTAPTVIDCDGSRFYILSQIEGSSEVTQGRRREILLPGHTVLLPATQGEVTITPRHGRERLGVPAYGDCALLKTYVPDLATNVIAPLRAAGVPDDAIVALGGQTELNDLAPLME